MFNKGYWIVLNSVFSMVLLELKSYSESTSQPTFPSKIGY